MSIPQPSALSTLISSTPKDPSHTHPHHTLALQVQHNLHYEHNWTSLLIHSHSPLSPQSPLSRPLISGLPPRRVYVHPDEQVQMLKRGVKEEDVGVEREWVLPTRLREKWTLRRFGEVFDGVAEEPPGNEEMTGAGEDGEGEGEKVKGKRRGGKRVLLATVGDDSTVVYYIVHDGIVKPRQN